MKRERPWYLSPSGRARLRHDREIVRERAPSLRFRTPQGDEVIAEGHIAMMAPASKIVTKVPTRIVFEKRYPRVPPWAFVLGTMFLPHDSSRHFMADKSCCLGLPGVDLPWDSVDQDALQPWLDQLVVFYQRQLIYDRRGEWSGPQWPHGQAAYAKFLEEVLTKTELIDAFLQFRSSSTNLPEASACPCDAGVSFADCHRDIFAALLPKLAGIPETALRGRNNVKEWPAKSSR